ERSAPGRPGKVDPFGQGQLRQAPQKLVIRCPADLRLDAGIGREPGEAPPEQGLDQRERFRARRIAVTGHGEPHGVISPGLAVAQDPLDFLRRQVRPPEELQVLRLGSHQGFPRRHAPTSRRASRPTATTASFGSGFSSVFATSADPTTTPSASRAASRAAAGVAIPKPTATGRSSRAARRPRATVRERSEGSESRAPVVPGRETTYRNPLDSRAARDIRPGGDVGETRNTVSRSAFRKSGGTAPAPSGGRSVTRTASNPAAFASRAERSRPRRSSGFT